MPMITKANAINATCRLAPRNKSQRPITIEAKNKSPTLTTIARYICDGFHMSHGVWPLLSRYDCLAAAIQSTSKRWLMIESMLAIKTWQSIDARKRRVIARYWAGLRPTTTLSWMAAAFLVALAVAMVVLATFGVGERGITIALRLTARWSFVLFWFAYVGSAMAKLFGPRFASLALHSRDFGLCFASAQVVHVGLVLWLIYATPGFSGAMAFFWIGILCTYLLALLSLPQLRDALGPRMWLAVRTAAIEYIALTFAADFILLRLQATGVHQYPLNYLPFALLLVGGAGLRAFVSAQQLLISRSRAAA
jgi:hypothetical protein